MAKPCSVCEHPDRAAIEIQLLNGASSTRAIGLRFTLDPSQINRHKNKHILPEIAARLKVRGARSDAEIAKLREVESKSLLDNLSWQRSRMYANADRALKVGDDAGERAAIAQAGKITEGIAKLVGELGQHITINNTQINLVQTPQWHAIRTALVRELRPLGYEAIAAGARAIQAAEACITQPALIDATPVREMIAGPVFHE